MWRGRRGYVAVEGEEEAVAVLGWTWFWHFFSLSFFLARCGGSGD